MRLRYFLPLLLLAVFIGCKEDEKTGSLEIRFTAEYGGTPLVLLDEHDYIDGQSVRFTHLDFYISDLEVVRSNGNVERLSDIDLIDLDFSTPQEAVAGTQRMFTGIPAGEYTMLRFGIGVKPSLNSMSPDDFASSNPLSRSSHYWAGWESYIFSKTEGSLDMDNDGTFDLGFTLHSGSSSETELYRGLAAQVNFDVTDGSTRTVVLILDYKKLLAVSEGGLDIPASPHTSDPGEMGLITSLVDNYAESFLISIP